MPEGSGSPRQSSASRQPSAVERTWSLEHVDLAPSGQDLGLTVYVDVARGGFFLPLPRSLRTWRSVTPR